MEFIFDKEGGYLSLRCPGDIVFVLASDELNFEDNFKTKLSSRCREIVARRLSLLKNKEM